VVGGGGKGKAPPATNCLQWRSRLAVMWRAKQL
jgi:hypothetical protein